MSPRPFSRLIRWLPFALIPCAIVILLAAYTLLVTAYVSTPGKLEQADFLTFYSAGQVARQSGFQQIYNLELEAAAQARTAGVAPGTQQILPPNHPPFLFPFLYILAGFDYRTAYIGYGLLLALLVAAGFPVLFRALRRNAWPTLQAWLALAGVILFEPVFISILKGQDSALLLLGGLLWFSGLLLEDDRLAGLGLSLTLIRPQIAVLLAVPFLFRRRKVFEWFCLGTLVLGVYSFALVGWQGITEFLHLLTLSAGGEGYGMAEAAMFNFTGLVLRLAPALGINLVHGLAWGLFAIAFAVLCIVWGVSKSSGLHQITLLVTVSLFVSPHLHYHDLALMIIPLLCLGLAAVKAGRLTVRVAAALPLLASLVFLLGEFTDAVRFFFPYLLMIFLPALAWWLERRGETGYLPT